MGLLGDRLGFQTGVALWLKTLKILHGLVFIGVFAVLARSDGEESCTASGNDLPASLSREFSSAFWQNCWLKSQGQSFADILCLESGYYALALDFARLTRAGFGLRGPESNLLDSLERAWPGIDDLPEASLQASIEKDGKVYRLAGCGAGLRKPGDFLNSVRLWESGTVSQHFDIQDLFFESEQGERLEARCSLDLATWPRSLALNLDVAPAPPLAGVPAKEGAWNNAAVRMSFTAAGKRWCASETFAGSWSAGHTNRITLDCNVAEGAGADGMIDVSLQGWDRVPHAVPFDAAKNCYFCRVELPRRRESGRLIQRRYYDEFSITIENRGRNGSLVPFALRIENPGGITGLCPVICESDGTPTGIPVQLSKNWHLGNPDYAVPSAILPAKPGTTRYLLRIPYGFYGTLPSASHAQLSLIGYSKTRGNTRWDQLAIGSWGETICFDIDTGLVDTAITDIRGLMLCKGERGRKWDWTDAGWGGDWLRATGADGQKLRPAGLKTAYLSQGPCLTDVRYRGFYGVGHEVGFKADVATLRTDDYARTFLDLDYSFLKPLPAGNASFFVIGSNYETVTPSIAYGNRDGLLGEITVPEDAEVGQNILDRLTLGGEGPWWIAFPGGFPVTGAEFGTGSRAVIIREFKASLGGKSIANPTISVPIVAKKNNASATVNLKVVPPAGVGEFRTGDRVSLNIEFLVVPRVAEDYYGPNEAFRRHLAEHPRSWKTIHREALGNDLDVLAEGGKVLRNYPLIVRAESPEEIILSIRGGVGCVPVRFENLPDSRYRLFRIVHGREEALEQAVHGNDYWQTTLNPRDKTLSMTFNLPLDGVASSVWKLRRVQSSP